MELAKKSRQPVISITGGLLVAADRVSHAAELEDYLARVRLHPALFSVTVPIGSGEEEISYERG